MNDTVSTVTGTAPISLDDSLAQKVLNDWVKRVDPRATIGPVNGIEASFQVGANASHNLATALRGIGFTAIYVDGADFVPTYSLSDNAIITPDPVKRTRAGKVVAPTRAITAVHANSTTLECGHIGRLPSGLYGRMPSHEIRVRCDTCLPLPERQLQNRVIQPGDPTDFEQMVASARKPR